MWSRSSPSRARAALHALREVTAEHGGAVPFAIALTDNHADEARSPSGTMAWVGYAACAYEALTGDTQYRSFALALARRLVARAETGALAPLVPLDERNAHAASTEHNIDVYFFLAALRKLGETAYEPFRRDLAAAVFAHLYDRRERRFLRGYDDRADELDCASWGAMLALDVHGAHDPTYAACIEHAYPAFWNATPPGFRPNREEQTVWIEGTLGVLCAMIVARNAGARHDAQRIADLERITRGYVRETSAGALLPYATNRTREFSDAPSLASTAWWTIARYLRSDAVFARVFWAG